MLSLSFIALITLGVDQLLYDDLSVWLVGLVLMSMRLGFLIAQARGAEG